MTPKKTTVATHEDLAVCKSDVVNIITEAFKGHERVEGVMYGKTLETLTRIEAQITKHIQVTDDRHEQNRSEFHGIKKEITFLKLKGATTDGAFSLAKWIVASLGGLGGLAGILYFLAQR
jgi:formylmethanofuran dehydrogenase subunit E